MRRFSVVLPLVLLFASVSSAAVTNKTVKATLSREIPEVNFNNVGFADAIDFLRELSGANFNVHWKTLEILHVTKETPVNVRLRHVSMRKALEIILAEAGASAPLSYYIDQGVIEITTRESADARMVTRVYDIGDLILEIPNFEGPNLNLTSAAGAGGSGRSGGGGGGGGNGIFGNSGNNSRRDEKASTRQERGEQLVKVIQNAIRPEIWQENGGTASIQYFHGRLIITAPRSVQEMIGGSFD